MIGGYEWDDAALTATVTPFQSLRTSLSGLEAAAQLVNSSATLTGTAAFEQHPTFTRAQVARAYGKHRAKSQRGKLFIGGRWVNVPR